MSRRFHVLEIAFLSNCAYVHSPIHPGRHMNASMTRREGQFFGYGNGCPQVPVQHQRPINLSDAVPDNRWQTKWSSMALSFTVAPLSFALPSPLMIRGTVVPRASSPELAKEFRRLVQDKYYENNRREQLSWAGFNRCLRIVVVVHVRYGDLAWMQGPSSFGRWTPDSYYMQVMPKVMASIAAAAGGRAIDVHVASEGRAAWAKISRRWEQTLRRAGASTVAFHIDSDLLSALHHMIEADALIMASSDFSRTAAFYSRGIVFDLGRAPRGATTDYGGNCTTETTECTYGRGRNHGLPRVSNRDQGLDTYELPEPPHCTCRTTANLTQTQKEWLRSAQYTHRVANFHCDLYCPNRDDVGSAARNLTGWSLRRSVNRVFFNRSPRRLKDCMTAANLGIGSSRAGTPSRAGT